MARLISPVLYYPVDSQGNRYIVRVVNGKQFIVKKPDMSKVVRSKKQIEQQNKFKMAVKFAQSILRDPGKTAKYKVKKGESVYNAAIREYFKKAKRT